MKQVNLCSSYSLLLTVSLGSQTVLGLTVTKI